MIIKRKRKGGMSCCCSCVADNNEALWLPKNSVRAIIAIIITLVTFTILSFLIVYLAYNKYFTEAISIAGIMSTALSSVVATYFANRNNQETFKKMDEIHDRQINSLMRQVNNSNEMNV